MGHTQSQVPYGPGQRRLKQIHVLYRYGARANTLQGIINYLQTEISLDRAQIQRLIRKINSLRRGVRDDLRLLKPGDGRQFEKELLNLIEYLQFEPDLPKDQTLALVKKLKKMRKTLRDDFEQMHAAFYESG